jgi:hypothetical protein
MGVKIPYLVDITYNVCDRKRRASVKLSDNPHKSTCQYLCSPLRMRQS